MAIISAKTLLHNMSLIPRAKGNKIVKGTNAITSLTKDRIVALIGLPIA